MKTKGFYLGWIMVHDLKKAVKFYTETLGFKLRTMDEKWKWAELVGHEGGAALGIGEAQGHDDVIKAGQNTVPTFSVEDLDKAVAEFKAKNGKVLGEIIEIPGHVRMQMAQDEDGNHFQIVQLLSKMDH